MEKFSVVYYSDLRNPEKVREYCLAQLKHVVGKAGGVIVPVIRTDGQPTHARLYRQILDGLDAAHTDLVFFAEDDVLYPETHFTDAPAVTTLGYDRNVWHLSPSGFFPSDWPGHFLSCLHGRKDAVRKAVAQKLAECEPFRLVHAEPVAESMVDWRGVLPVVDARHGRNFTGMRDSDAAAQIHEFWGDVAVLLKGMDLPV